MEIPSRVLPRPAADADETMVELRSNSPWCDAPSGHVRLRGASIRTKAMIPVIGCTLAFAVITFFVLSGSIANQEIKALAARGTTIAELLSQNVAPGLAFHDPLAIEEVLQVIDSMAEVAYVAVLGVDGRPLTTRGLGDDGDGDHIVHAAVDASSGICPTCNLVHARTPVHLYNEELGSVALGMSTAKILAAIHTQRRQLLLITGAMLLVGIVTVALFMRRILGPVLDLTVAARRMASGQLRTEVEVQAHDELGVLAASFNEMARSLATSRQRIEEQNHTLERRIEERTRELRERTEDALEASRMKSEFLANISHELRTPLNGILGFAGLLANEDLGGEEAEFARTIQESAQNLLTIVNDILDISKIESGHVSMCSSCYSPGRLAREAVAAVRPRALQQRLDLALSLADDVPEVAHGDPVRIRQVLVNLLGNAVKFTERGSVTLRIDRATLPGGVDALRYAVTDTGIGIPADKQSMIFDAFAQVDGSATRRYGGTGLGLTITRQLVELMYGEIEVSSIEGRGSTFTITIPMRLECGERTAETADHDVASDSASHVACDDVSAAPSAALPVALSVARAIPPPADDAPTGDCPGIPSIDPANRLAGQPNTPGSRPARLLVAEDNPTNLRLALRLLDNLGIHEVLTARDGRECLALLEESHCDLILLDMQMPLLDGYETARTIRRHPAWRRIPIIALTVHAMVGDEEGCLAAGCDAYLSKPYEAAALEALIMRHLPAELLPGRFAEDAAR